MWGAVIEEGKRKGGKFYRSKDKKDLNRPPFGSYMMNKKWTLEEEFTNHMLMFQQVTGSCIFYIIRYILTFQAGLMIGEASFKEEKEDDEPKPLIMEDFHFPLCLLLAGLILSAIFLLAELFIHRIRKSKTDVAIAKLEEPSVTQSTQESENLDEMVGEQ